MSTKILTIDDSRIIRLIIAKAFESYDCAIMEAANGADGLAIASREKPDVILMDYSMRPMDGFEVLKRLRADEGLKTTPVIMLTSMSDRETVVRIARLGVRDYVVKPFKQDALIERVSRVVALQSKSESGVKAKRVDDPIHLLVADDKPAIAEQIRAGLAGTPWKVTGAAQPAEALDLCVRQGIDIVLASLSFPRDGAQQLLQNLRSYARTASIPVLGLCVKTAATDQAGFSEAGFGGIVTKPIDCEDLKAKIARALKLETSYLYLQQRDGALVFRLPKECNPEIAEAVACDLKDQLTAMVDAGGDKFIVDLSALEELTHPVIKLVFSVIRAAGDLSIKYAMAGSKSVRANCQVYEESQGWKFASTVEEAAALLK
jgi:two-component system cell cycle response regulator